MKLKATLLFSAFFFCFSFFSMAQSAGDYRSNVVVSGIWSDASSWERFDGTGWTSATTAPQSTDGTITIQEGDSIQLTTAVTIDQLYIQSGGILSIFDLENPLPKTVVTLNDVEGVNDIEVTGKLYISVGVQLAGMGTINIHEGGLLFLRRQGVLGAATTIQSSGAMYIDEDPTLQSTLTNNGTITWFRNNFRLVNGTLINN